MSAEISDDLNDFAIVLVDLEEIPLEPVQVLDDFVVVVGVDVHTRASWHSDASCSLVTDDVLRRTPGPRVKTSARQSPNYQEICNTNMFVKECFI